VRTHIFLVEYPSALPHTRPIESDEDQRRIATLERLRLLDPEPEPFFEDLLELLQHVCEAPIAVISLTDRDRQWFKVRRGVDATEVPRKDSFCAHVVATGKPLALHDAAADPHFRNNDLVTGPMQIRAYAGAPIVTADNVVIGTMCMLDTQPRQWADDKIHHLQGAARMVASHAEARAAYAELASRNARITEREASAGRQRQIISAMNEGVVVHAPDGTVIDSNRAASLILGLTEDQLHGRSPLDPGWQAENEDGIPIGGENHPAMRALATGVPQKRVIMSVARPDHDRRHLMVNAVPLELGAPESSRQVLATFIDITDQIAQQRQLNELLANAEKANQAKTEFLAAMSHEIRTPLNGLLGVAQHLARRITDPQLLPSIALLRSSGLALKDIVDDALDIDRIEAGSLRVRTEDFALADTLRDVVAVYAPAAAEKQLSLTTLAQVPEDLHVHGDAGRLRQILHNLVSNAVKYTSRGGVQVHARISEAQPGWQLTVEVIDTGRGISPDFADTVFAKFTRLEDNDQQEGGAGLGLYLSLKLARLLGGDLSFRSNAPGGSIFQLVAPLAPAIASTAPDTAETLTTESLRVLIAEDHQVNRAIFQLLLEPFNMTGTFVEDGKQALEAARTGAFDLILMDRQMPGLDGVDVTRQLRQWQAQHGQPRTPIIFVSANGAPQSIALAREAGADGYVTKPIIVEALAKEIARVLHPSHA